MAKLVIRTEGLPAETLKLKTGRNRVGRSSENDFQIQHDTISRFHCEIEVLAESMVVRDLDSSNGTFVNEEPVSKATLESGQMLRLGDVQLEVCDAPRPPDPDSVLMCSNHPTFPASMQCTQCQRVFCGTCIHLLRRSGGMVLRLCPVCSGRCEPLQGLGPARKGVLGNLLGKFLKR
ncbi:MAG TPA: FHA domain-containing RING-H2 finger protein [Dongiaceae bacterium]|nr:FHA domain-containing RING-H2 finger protein [Dongiaceae bacterium]